MRRQAFGDKGPNSPRPKTRARQVKIKAKSVIIIFFDIKRIRFRVSV
jgi:hypothetical protein